MLISGITTCVLEILWVAIDGHQALRVFAYLCVSCYCTVFVLFAALLNRYLLDRMGIHPNKKWNIIGYVLSDYLYCADCGSKLWYHTNTINKDIHFFSCSNYKSDYRGTCSTRHYIRADAIEQVVLLELRRLAAFLRYDEDTLVEILAQKTNREMQSERKRLEAELQKATTRSDTVVRMYEKLYEDNATGKVTDEWFMQLSHKYEVERIA